MSKTLALITDGDTDALSCGLSRLAASHPGFQFLLVGSATVEARSRAGAADRAVNAELLLSPFRQGPGGYRKLGLRYALEAGFDHVVQLDGDIENAAELLPRFRDTLVSTGADVIIGAPPSRRSISGVLRSALTGRRLRGGVTGPRAYSAGFLRSIPFEINTNDELFDTEVLLQALAVGATIEELEVPPVAGGHGRVGAGLALRALRATAAYRMHRVGMLCSLKYRRLDSGRYRDKTWTPYSSHARALEVVRRARPRTVLDLGCGPGHVARTCERMGAAVTGVDREPPAGESLSDFHLCDFETAQLPVDALAYDMVLMLDVIEHLANPEGFLVGLRNASARAASGEAPKVVLTTPNIAFVSIRLNLLVGRFNYAERGILDITHKRLFTRRSLFRTLEDCGYRIEKLSGIGVPFEAVMGGRGGRFLDLVSNALARLWPSLFAFQFLVVCRPLPGVRQLLRESRDLSAGGAKS